VYGLVEFVDVDPHPAVGAEQHHVVAERDHVAGRPGGGQGAACGVQHLVQVVRGGRPVEVRPQEIVEPLPVHPVARCRAQQLQQAAGLAQPPRPGGDGAFADRHRGSAEEPDVHLIGHGVLVSRLPPDRSHPHARGTARKRRPSGRCAGPKSCERERRLMGQALYEA
jgi:hypothetical protein